MRKLLLAIWLLCLCSSGIAQASPEPPSYLITRFKYIQLTGGIILLQGRLDPFPDTLSFVFDTGSGGISLDSMTARYFGLEPLPSDRLIRGIAGIRSVRFLNNRKLHLPGLSIDSLNLHVNDYSILTSVYGEKIDGIIGYSVMSRFIIKVDYDEGFIEFWSRGSIKYPKRGHLLKPFINTLPVQTASIKDEHRINTRFLYDMGAGLNLMLTTDFIRDSALMKKKRKYFNKEAEGMGGKIDIRLTVVRDFRIGPYRFKNVPTYVFDDIYNVTSYPYLGGLIGNDLLRRFNVVLNYPKSEIHLLPNTHYADAFDYSYTGMELYYENGEILIGDVARDSPAEKAGIKEGDVVLALNGKFHQNMQVYKAAMQVAGDKIKLIVYRNGKLMDFTIPVKSILH